ncbi:MAG: 3-methyl-2-oxobutanoate hydroxymethyltransferase [Chthoniobacterales bacterium]|nr:3-methyl-2-oxobutanoate hydroxymethyltransferase [Chthoniobacterales bacterium]MCX7712337.1 3-methyl-2-oxobutanoate hydroxymethyltransferase [Chthoniobacterales bacterium]
MSTSVLQSCSHFLSSPTEKIALIHQKRSTRIPITALTAYSYPWARLLDQCELDLILVGDSLGMVEHGRPNTVTVTLEEMLYHTRSVRPAVKNALLVADLPYGTYESPHDALQNASQLIHAGADAVKLEGGSEIAPQIQTLIKNEIPVLGHLGMLPQRILQEGRYRIKGRTPEERSQLVSDANLLQNLGVFAIVLELVTPELADEITKALSIPTIGIGSGPNCAGQILVTYDLLGFTPWFCPSFVTPKANLAETIQQVVKNFVSETKSYSYL